MGDQYIPGSCNIGKSERNSRRLAGIISLAVSVIIWICVTSFSLDRSLILVSFFPLFFGILNLLQSYMSFCVYFGLFSLYNFFEPGNQEKVIDNKFKRKDKEKAIKLILLSCMATLITIVMLYRVI
jgi:hypothetical protein